MESQRVRSLNKEGPGEGRYLLYWMQQAQRTRNNAALAHAIDLANRHDLPLVVGFGLTAGYPEANQRHYAFMLEGLAEVAQELAAAGIAFVLREGAPDDVALELARDARMVVCDAGYLRHQRAWRARVAKAAGRTVEMVETDVVVPVGLASRKAEHGARTIRPKLLALRVDFLTLPATERVRRSANGLALDGIDLREPARLLDRLKLDRSVEPVGRFQGGTSAARARLEEFLDERFEGYAERRSEPIARACSELSPYLHFGQISPVEMALAAKAASGVATTNRAAFLEELIVRRELSMNFVAYTPEYDRYDCIPDWARQSLAAHRDDPRPHLYDQAQLEAGETHDPYWNAAMREMRVTGYMHNYMRMYWGKKILEWSRTAEDGHSTTIAINNKYFLDGRDANSYANIGWIYGLHDRAWTERAIFGKVRYMNDKGLERKFDIKAYVRWAESL